MQSSSRTAHSFECGSGAISSWPRTEHEWQGITVGSEYRFAIKYLTWLTSLDSSNPSCNALKDTLADRPV